MGARLPRVAEHCVKCGDPIPTHRRSDAKYCTARCSEAAEKKRYCDRHPEYVKRQRKLVTHLRHMKEHGHTDYIDHPDLNPKDRFRVARSLGYRSMLEVSIARQLEAAGMPFQYESLSLPYNLTNTMTANWYAKKNHGLKIKAKLRSGLEERVAAQLDEEGVEYEYEKVKLPYQIEHTYNPDFNAKNGIIIECKGLFTSEDRSKHLAVKKQHPGIDVRFVFSRSNSPLYKGSKSTYAMWCQKHGYPYADKLIPAEWLAELKERKK